MLLLSIDLKRGNILSIDWPQSGVRDPIGLITGAIESLNLGGPSISSRPSSGLNRDLRGLSEENGILFLRRLVLYSH